MINNIIIIYIERIDYPLRRLEKRVDYIKNLLFFLFNIFSQVLSPHNSNVTRTSFNCLSIILCILYRILSNTYWFDYIFLILPAINLFCFLCDNINKTINPINLLSLLYNIELIISIDHQLYFLNFFTCFIISASLYCCFLNVSNLLINI